jgi:hypothetical protein
MATNRKKAQITNLFIISFFWFDYFDFFRGVFFVVFLTGVTVFLTGVFEIPFVVTGLTVVSVGLPTEEGCSLAAASNSGIFWARGANEI